MMLTTNLCQKGTLILQIMDDQEIILILTNMAT